MAKLHERPLRIFRPLSQHLEARQPAAGRQWDHLPAPDRPEPRRPLRPHEPHGGIEPGQAADARRVYLRAPAHHHRALRKKKIALAWQKEQDTLLAGFPAKRLAFTYQDEHQTAMFELHIFRWDGTKDEGAGQGAGLSTGRPAASRYENAGDLSAGTRPERGQPSGANISHSLKCGSLNPALADHAA